MTNLKCGSAVVPCSPADCNQVRVLHRLQRPDTCPGPPAEPSLAMPLRLREAVIPRARIRAVRRCIDSLRVSLSSPGVWASVSSAGEQDPLSALFDHPVCAQQGGLGKHNA